ncbi:hypothetical protein [Micromonospora sp. NPDC049102]|uniref:hypothetical protein n=1 Tax=Micromonospora sp. NPDC049102 TaxID=3364265 RepID=UPI003721598A
MAIKCREFVATWLPQGMYLGLEQGSVPSEVFDAQAVPGAHLLHVAPESVNSAAVRDMLLAQPPGVVAQMVDGSARSVAVGLDKAGAFARADALGLPVLHPGNTLAGVHNERILAIDAQERPARTPADAKYVLVLPELHLLAERSASRRELDASLSQVLIGPPMLSQVRLIDADEAELGIPPLILDTLIDRVGGIVGVDELATSAAEASPVQGGVMGLWRALAALELGEARLLTVDAPGDDTATTVLALRFPGGVGLLHDTSSGVRAATLPRCPAALSIAHADVSEKATALAQTGRLGRLPLDTTGLALNPLSNDVAQWTPATQAVDVPPVTVSVQSDHPSGDGAHLDAATRDLLATLSARAVAAARRSGPIDVQVDGGWSGTTPGAGNAAAPSQALRVQAVLDHLMPLIRRGLAELGLHRDTVTVDVVRRGPQTSSATTDATSGAGVDQHAVTVRLLPARRMPAADPSSADQHLVVSVNELLVRDNRNASAAVILDARDAYPIRQTDVRGIASAVADRIRSGGLSDRMLGGSRRGVDPQYGLQQFGAGQAIRGLQQAQLAGGSSTAPRSLADMRALPHPMRGHLLGLAAADGSVSLQAVADARPDVRTLFLRFTNSGVDVGPIDELTRNERRLGILPEGRNKPRRPVRIIINTPDGEAGEAVLDQLRRAFRDTGREAFVPAPGNRVALFMGDLAVVNSQREPGRWESVGAKRPTEPRHYTTDPVGLLGRPMADARFLPTEDELVWWIVRDSTLPASLEPPAGESIRSFGLELEFDFEPGIPEQEIAVRRSRMVNDLRALGLTKQFLVRSPHSAREKGYNSRRSGWTLETDSSVAGEVVSPILPYQQGSDEERSRVWRDVALALAVIRRHGGRSSTKVGGHVHLGVGDYQRDVVVMQRLIDLFRGHQDILYRLASRPGQRLHRGIFYAAPIAPPAASGQQRDWPNFDLRLDGGIDHSGSERDTALNRMPLVDAYKAGRPAKDDHIEVRIFDGDLSLGGVQLRTELSRALADKATEPSGRVPQHSTLGEHFLRWDPKNKEDAAALKQILDLLPAEATAARLRVTELWQLTAWQMPLNIRTSYRNGLFFPRADPGQDQWKTLSPVAERNLRQPAFVYKPWTRGSQAAKPVALSILLQQWKPSGAGTAPAIAHGVVIALAKTPVDNLGMLPGTLGVSVVQPVGNQWSVQAISEGGWWSASGWELLTRDAAGVPITRLLGQDFGPHKLEEVLGELRAIGPVSSAPVAGTATSRDLGLVLGSEQSQLSQGDLAWAPRVDSVGDGSWLGDDAQPVMWQPLPGARGGWALLPDRELAQVGDLELPGEGASVPVVVHPAANGTVGVLVRDLDGVGQDVAASTPMDGGSLREVRLTAEQLAPSLDRRLPPGAPVALLSCRAGELSDGFARQLATALGRDVVAPTRDLVVEPPGGQTRLFTVEGESWVLFTPEFGDWDVMNDEIDGFVDDDGVAHLSERAVYPFDGIAAVTLPPSWSMRLPGGVAEQYPDVYVIGKSAAPRMQKLINELAEVANVDHPVVVLGAAHPSQPVLASDVAGLNYMLEQLAQRERLPVVVARGMITSELLTVVQRYGATILHPTTQRPDNAGIGLDMYWKATASRRDERTAASVHLWPQITADVLRTAVTLARPTPAIVRVEDTLGELIWAADLTTARRVFTNARQRWSPEQMRDNLTRVEQMIERVPDQADLSRYAPILEFGATGHADIVFDYALADAADKPATLLTAVGNLDTAGQLNANLDGGLTTGRLAAMVTAVGTTDISASVLTVIGDIKAGRFTDANTFIERNRGLLTTEQKQHWIDAITDLLKFPTMQNNKEQKLADNLEKLAQGVLNC